MERAKSLRDVLRSETRDLHDVLDQSLSPLANDGGYPTFLAIQYAARWPVEAWFAQVGSVMQPPVLTGLVELDLAELGCTPPACPISFRPADPAEALGIAWVLAGSSLGNRVLHKRRLAYDGGRATAFLSDQNMPRFWGRLRPRLCRQASDPGLDKAIDGARRTFGHFIAVAQVHRGRIAA